MNNPYLYFHFIYFTLVLNNKNLILKIIIIQIISRIKKNKYIIKEKKNNYLPYIHNNVNENNNNKNIRNKENNDININNDENSNQNNSSYDENELNKLNKE